MFEVSLTRLFSIYLWYHFAFMVIGIAMLGIGAAGTMLAVFQRQQGALPLTPSPNKASGQARQGRGDKFNALSGMLSSESSIAIYALLAGLSIFFSYIVSNYVPFDPVKFSWDRAQFFYLALYCIVLSVPFFFAGLLTASAFSRYSEKSGLIYGSDLLGAGTGSLAVLLLLNSASAEYAVFSASLLCLTGALLTGRRKEKITALLFILINLFMISAHPDFIKVKMSPYKGLSVYLKFPGAEHLKTYYSSHSQIDLFKSPAVRFAPGLSLLYADPLPDQTGLSTDGDRVDVITDARERSRLKFLEYLPSASAYETGGRNDVLVLEPGGGLHALMAAYYGCKTVHKVESDPLMINIIRNNYNTYSGEIYKDNTWTGYGRSFLRSGEQSAYDLIDLPMTGASVSGTFGILEDYRLTVEAFKQYMKALKPDGMISISLYLVPPPRTEFRILSTLVTALEEAGVTDAGARLAAIRSWDSMTLLVKNSPLAMDEIMRIKEFSRQKRFDLLYYPGIKEGESGRYITTASDEYFRGFQDIFNPETRPAFINGYLFDIRPVYDDNPFFHYYLRLSNIEPIYETMGRNWLYFMDSGYLLPVLLVILAALSAIIILLPALYKRFEQFKRFERLTPVIIYFSMLGLGFMFVEVTLIQKAILLLENPAYSIAVVVTAILAGSGTGSVCCFRFPKIGSPFSLLLLSLLISVFSLTLPAFSSLLLTVGPMFRTAAIFTILLPLGFLMGIPFPTGMKLAGEKYRGLVPWLWAVNACLSVLAPVLTIMLALVTGFIPVLWISASAYFLAFISLKKLTKNHGASTP